MVPSGKGDCQNSKEANCADALNTDALINNACQCSSPADEAAIPNITPNKNVEIK